VGLVEVGFDLDQLHPRLNDRRRHGRSAPLADQEPADS
jgi:hypothetical protein